MSGTICAYLTVSVVVDGPGFNSIFLSTLILTSHNKKFSFHIILSQLKMIVKSRLIKSLNSAENNCMKKVLVVIDMQSEFLRSCKAENIASAVAEKMRQRRAEGYKIFLTLDKSGGEIDESVKNACRIQKIYRKRSYGCRKLLRWLIRCKPDKIEFVGVCTDICVITNVLGIVAFLPSAEIFVDKNCCAAEGEGHEAALRVMGACNVKII